MVEVDETYIGRKHKFNQAARELDADEDENRWQERLKKGARHKTARRYG